ncbi:MAG: DUF6391 domain-containing protein [Anaerolineae bacterium]|nr:DUF6391 domain-containing protein [Anaerolineae bacterium]
MFLDLPLILETRRNHALEHATIHILAEKYPDRHIAGHSNPTGFFILGNVSTEDLTNAVDEALTRLRAGESNLAVHPGCGTNYATTALLAGTLAWLPLSGSKSNRQRLWLLPIAVGFAILGYTLSRPLGPFLQAKVTTEADMGNLQIEHIRLLAKRGLVTHRVITKNKTHET